MEKLEQKTNSKPNTEFSEHNSHGSQFFSGSTRPLVLTEGETDVEYIKTGFTLLGYDYLLDQVDIEWVGKHGPSGPISSGKDGLNSLYKAFAANQGLLQRRLLLLYDADANKSPLDEGLVSIRSIPRNEENQKVRVGIENLFAESLFEASFYSTKEEQTGYGERRAIERFKKVEFQNHICNVRRNPGDFANFEDIADIVEDFLGAHRELPHGDPLIRDFSEFYDDCDEYPSRFVVEMDFIAGASGPAEIMVSDVEAARSFGAVEFLLDPRRDDGIDIIETKATIRLTKGRHYTFLIRATPSERSRELHLQPAFRVGLLAPNTPLSIFDDKVLERQQTLSRVIDRFERAAYTLYHWGRFPGFPPNLGASVTFVPGIPGDHVQYTQGDRRNGCYLAQYSGELGHWECYVRPDTLMPSEIPK